MLQAELVILGGAFFVNGNINPAAEANIFGDPEAADFVLGQPASIRMVGLDATHEVDSLAGLPQIWIAPCVCKTGCNSLLQCNLTALSCLSC